MQQEESAAKCNVSSKVLFILQVLREFTLPLLIDTEMTCTGVDIKYRAKFSEGAPKHRYCES